MGEREKERPCGVQPRVAEGLSDEELAQIFSRSSWTKQEVAAVLREQRRSGRSIMDFAALHGISGYRLYYWKRRWSRMQLEVPQVPAPWVTAESSAPTTTVDLERELAPEALQRALGRELSSEAEGDRQVQQYVMRAVRSEDKMWSVYELRASGSVLRCAVRWAGSCDPRPYSWVELDRTAPALWWEEFETLKEALSEFHKRAGGRSAACSDRAVQRLLPVQILDSNQAPCIAASPDEQSTGAVTVALPSGVRIQIPNGAAPELVRPVLETTLGVPS